MSPNELIRALAAPFTNSVLLLAMGTFFLLTKLALAAGLLGVWLLLVLLPAAVRFLMDVVDARIAGRPLEPPGIEMFTWVSGAWTLMPVFLLLAAGWSVFWLQSAFGGWPAVMAVIAFLLFFPASIAVLVLTRSVLGSINPAALITLIRICGPHYWQAPLSVIVVAAVAYGLQQTAAPRLLVEAAYAYAVFLLFSLTGAVVAESDAADRVEMPGPVEPDSATLDALDEKTRVNVLDHAYGFVSRGNREGGLAHVEQFLRASDQRREDYEWFFQNMLRWENTDPALYFGQRYLSFLLDSNEPLAALKLLSRCHLENPRFRPLAQDRERLLALARQHGRGDLEKQLS